MSDLNVRPRTLEEAMAREYPPPTPSPCNECPWRRDAMPGHLGPHMPSEWLDSIHGEVPIACHKTIPRGGGWGTKTKQCRGAAIFRENVCKHPRNPTIATGPPDAETCFGTNLEFVAHHTPTSPFEQT